MLTRAFYTVADARFFPGVVALFNSLRIVGHEERLTILDCGFEPAQRALLEPHATLVRNASGLFASLAKWCTPVLDPADVMVHIDADIIVVRSLTPLIELASQGRVVAIQSLHEHERFFPEWQTRLGLGPLQRRPHVQSGLVAFPRDPGLALMRRMTQLADIPDLRESRYGESGGKGKLGPFYYPDQDVMNALFAAELPDSGIAVIDPNLMAGPHLAATAIRDLRSLDCRVPTGRTPYVIHAGRNQPWVRHTLPSAYSTLLSRLLFWDDLPIRLDPHDFPLSLRPGLLPGALRQVRLHRWKVARGTRASLSLARAALHDPKRVYPFVATRVKRARHKAGAP